MCEGRIGQPKTFGRKIPHARQTSKMAQHNLFFYVKMYRVLLKYLLERGKKDITYKERKGANGPGAHNVKYKGISAPFPELTGHHGQSTKVTKQEKQI